MFISVHIYESKCVHGKYIYIYVHIYTFMSQLGRVSLCLRCDGESGGTEETAKDAEVELGGNGERR